MTGVSTLGQALSQINRINVQQRAISDLSNQLATGRITQRFSGLENDALTSQRARADFAALDVYNSNITNSTRRIQQIQLSLGEFQQQTINFQNVVGGLSQQSVHQEGEIVYYDDPTTPEDDRIPVGQTSAEADIDLRAVVDFAENIEDTFLTLLNVQDGDRFLLSGAETSTQPVTDNGTLDAAISTLIIDWKEGNITTDELIADLKDRTTETNPNALTDSTVGYSAALSAGDVGDIFVRVDENVEVKYTTLANEQAFRDVLVAVAFIQNENLTPIADAYIPPNTAGPGLVPDVLGAPGDTLDEQKDNFFQVINEIFGILDEAIDNIDFETFRLANAEARIAEVQINHEQEQNFLLGTVSEVEDVDQNEVALQLNTLLSQLEVSFAVTSRVQQLSLVNFI